MEPQKVPEELWHRQQLTQLWSAVLLSHPLPLGTTRVLRVAPRKAMRPSTASTSKGFMPAMGKGILLSGLSLGFCGCLFPGGPKHMTSCVNRRFQKFQIAQVVRSPTQCSGESCLLWKMLLPDWNGFAHKREAGRELKRS